jgi:hypothetical protein
MPAFRPTRSANVWGRVVRFQEVGRTQQMTDMGAEPSLPEAAGSGQAAFGGPTEQKQTFAVRRPNRRVRPAADIDRRRLAEA